MKKSHKWRKNAIRESSALWEAETIRKQQEKKYFLEMDRFKLLNAELTDDVLRVREQFAQIQSCRSPDLERSDHRIEKLTSWREKVKVS